MEQYWTLSTSITVLEPGDNILPHQTAEQVAAELAEWAQDPEERLIEIMHCDCELCDVSVAPEPDRCECGGILEPSSMYREICRTCGKVYDEIPF